jgi:hypothetical protein
VERGNLNGAPGFSVHLPSETLLAVNTPAGRFELSMRQGPVARKPTRAIDREQSAENDGAPRT